MKTLISFFVLACFTFGGFNAEAAAKHKTNKTAGKKLARSKTKTKVTKTALPGAGNSQLGTSFSFDPASVRGKYQTAGQGIASVENEKVMDDLLGLRIQFKDRELQEASRK